MDKITGTKIYSVDTTCEENAYSVVVTDDPSRDWINVLEIRFRGDLIGSYLDHGAPEDNSFYRGYAWVAVQLEKAFELGRLVAVQETMKEVEELRKMVEECQTDTPPPAADAQEKTSESGRELDKLAAVLAFDQPKLDYGKIDTEVLKRFWVETAKTMDEFGTIFDRVFVAGLAKNVADVEIPRQSGEEAPPLRGGEDDKSG